jgi:hypothetical protein
MVRPYAYVLQEGVNSAIRKGGLVNPAAVEETS